MNATATTYRNLYGATDSNALVDGAAYHGEVDYSTLYSLADVAAEGGKVTRVSILTERGLGDVSYVHATLPNGRIVNVQVGVDNLTPLRSMKKAMIEWAKSQGVYAKGLGLIDESNWSVKR